MSGSTTIRPNKRVILSGRFAPEIGFREAMRRSTDVIGVGGTPSLERRYRQELSVLEELFGYATVHEKVRRLNEIHEYTEEKWRQYVAQIPGGTVNYLLIAEAPPWSGPGTTPQYVLDPSSRPRTLMRAPRNSFAFLSQLATAEVLGHFAQQGLLIVDSTPFAMDYSAKRAAPNYEEFIRLCAHTYLEEQLNLPLISWSSNVRIAFSLKLNALEVIKACGNQLSLGATRFPISPELIAVNAAGYPDGEKLRALYALRRER